MDEPLTVYKDGRMIRAFTHVKDIVDGIILVMEKGSDGEIYNLGNPSNKTSIAELAERVVRLTGSNSDISHVDPKILFGPLFEEANDKYPDADRAMHDLGWHPVHGIDDIILDSCEYIKSQRRD
jgi:UDP-glucose 4-epimerase